MSNSVDFYWRPGCPFCMMLEKGLEKKGIEMVKHNIWEDSKAADYVRSVADGNETVPTVKIGEQVRVNPSAREVEKLLKKES